MKPVRVSEPPTASGRPLPFNGPPQKAESFRLGAIGERSAAAEIADRAGVSTGNVYHHFPDKDAIFRTNEAESAPVPPNVWGGQISDVVPPLTFYRQFKSLALVGYFASEQVGGHVLSYDPIPGRFDGCIPVSNVGNAWSL